jgi:C1A family cysteine protease
MKILKAILIVTLFSLMLTLGTGDGEIIDAILDSFKGNVKDLFKTWHFLFKKQYTLDIPESKSRFRIFKENLKYINDFNTENNGVTLGLNQFSDLTLEEYQKLTNNPTVHENFLNKENERLTKKLEDDEQKIKNGLWESPKKNYRGLYEPIDFRQYFLSARDQFGCGSCWAFSAVGAIEGNRAIKFPNSKKEYLSTQQLVDCDKRDGGCNGGMPYSAFSYVQKNGGLAADSEYKYTAEGKQCNSTKEANVTSQISSYSYCEGDCTEDDFYNLLKQGPLAVVISSESNAFKNYRSGIFKTVCASPMHAVTAVGYGIQGDTDYWIIRNSWGVAWGMKGYMYVKRNYENQRSCFITYDGWLPVVTK